MTDHCKKCPNEIDKEDTHAIITIKKRGGSVVRYYLCEAHANELQYIWLDGD